MFEAALHDQELFNSLADEQALKDLLDDPASRRRLLAALEEPKPSVWAAIAAWLRRPTAWAAAGGLAAVALLVTLFIRTEPPPAVEQVAMKIERRAPAPPAARRDEPAASLRPEPMKTQLPEARRKRVESKEAEPARRQQAAVPPRELEAREEAAGRIALNEPPPPAAPPPAAEWPAQVALTEAPPAPPRTALVATPPAGGKARELYYLTQPRAADLRLAKSAATEEAAGKARVAPSPVGIRCGILKAGADGQYGEADPQGPFRSGDSLRVSVEANENGFLYILRGDRAGKWDLLFKGQVAQRTRYVVPDKDGIQLEGPSGEIRILAAFSRTPLGEPMLPGRDERSRKGRQAETTAEADRLAAAFRLKSDDLNLRVDKDTQERSIYAVSPQPESEPSIVLEIPVRWNQ